MRVVTGGTAFPHGLMLKDKWSRLCRVTLGTGSAFRHQHALREQVFFFATMGIMAIHTGCQALSNRMTVRQGKLPLHIEVTLEARCRGTSWIVDQVATLPFLRVKAAWTMTALATDNDIVFVRNHQAGVSRIGHRPPEIFMTEHAILIPHKLRPLRLGHHEYSPVDRLTGNQPGQDGTHGDPQTSIQEHLKGGMLKLHQGIRMTVLELTCNHLLDNHPVRC